MKALRLGDCFFTIEAEDNDFPPDYDEEGMNEQILSEAQSNPWAWCRVTMICRNNRFPGIVGVDYLGGCSYGDERDFILHSGYYEGMQKEAFADLMDSITYRMSKEIG